MTTVTTIPVVLIEEPSLSGTGADVFGFGLADCSAGDVAVAVAAEDVVLVVPELFVGTGCWLVVAAFELADAGVLVVARVGVADVVVDSLAVVGIVTVG